MSTRISTTVLATAIAMPMNTENAKNSARTRRIGQEVFIR